MRVARQLNAYVPDDLYDWVNRAAEDEGMKVSVWLRTLIERERARRASHGADHADADRRSA